MQMTTKGRLAIVAMIDLALRPAGRPVTLSAISQHRKISMSYLEQLFAKMRRAGLVQSMRGPGGGYVLARPAGSITAADIVIAVDDAEVVREDELQFEAGSDRGRCDTSGLWRDVNARMLELLGSISLGSLVDQQPANAPSIDESPRRRGISPAPVVKPVRTNAANSVFALGRALSAPGSAS